MEIVQTGKASDRNVMWKNYRAHPIIHGRYETFELDFEFFKDTDPETALQSISTWHRDLEKEIADADPSVSKRDLGTASVLFVCNETELWRGFNGLTAQFRGILTFGPGYEADFVMSEQFPIVKRRGFRITYRQIPLSLYAGVNAAQVEWLTTGECAEMHRMKA